MDLAIRKCDRIDVVLDVVVFEMGVVVGGAVVGVLVDNRTSSGKQVLNSCNAREQCFLDTFS